ncbi:MAG: S8 family serine peptidase [Anaerolineales bacterium]|nr:S8 family serine peptidase [Anaerolineales bacterium]
MRKKLHLLTTIVVLASLVLAPGAVAQGGRTPTAVDDGPLAVTAAGPATDGPVAVSLRLNVAPLVDVAAGQAVAQAMQIAAVQDQVAAQVEALGGAVLFRFRNLSSGLAVRIDSAKVADLGRIASVVGVRRINNYELDLSDTVPFIGAAELQAAGLDGTGVTVAVLDDGADYTHVKLGGSGLPADYAACAATSNVLAPACTAFFPNSKVIGGYDFVGGQWTGGAGSPPEVPDPNPIARSFHGTHVADIIAGLPGGGVGPGVAPGASVYAFKVCSELTTSCSGPAILAGLDAAADLDGNPANGLQPADVVNMSLGSNYGQPEDDSTYFANQAVKAGAIVVASAGNGSDKPYIAGSPSTATGAISVAQTTVPSDKRFFIGVNAPTARVISNTAFQDWSVPLTTAISGDVFYDTTNANTRRGCLADGVTSPWAPGALAGRVVLIDRGTCAGSIKAANANAAGAKLVIIALVASGAPFSFAYGGGTVTTPAFMVTQADGTLLKTAGTNITMDPNNPALVLNLLDTMVGTSSRGPRNHDNYIKPDIGAPGGSRSAEFGTGTGTTPFGGTSGAAPMVSGAAVLLKQKYGGQALPGFIGDFGGEMPVWMYKALLMGTANTGVYEDFFGGKLAPISRIGGGRVDVKAAAQSGTVAWDETDHWIDPRFRTGSMSFGYQAVAGKFSATRHGVVANLTDTGRWYDLSAAFRYADDAGKGVTVKVSPARLYVEPGSYKEFFVTLTADAAALKTWTGALNYGSGGLNTAALTDQEYDGYITIDGGAGNTVHLAWHLLPKKAASVRPTQTSLNFGASTAKTLTLSNPAKYQAGDVDVFALVERNPNDYFYTVQDDIMGTCTSAGLNSGCNQGVIDLKEVGLRDYSGFIEFGLTVWDSPYRAGQMPAAFDIYVDANRDGTDDYVIESWDLGCLQGACFDGRNVVAVFNLATGAGTIRFFTDAGVDTQNWILPVVAADIGVAAGQQFNFRVNAWDGYFSGAVTDCSPNDCTSYHTYTLGKPKFAVDNFFPTVPANGTANLAVTKPAGGAAASPSQIGLLLMYRQAPIERESNVVVLK